MENPITKTTNLHNKNEIRDELTKDTWSKFKRFAILILTLSFVDLHNIRANRQFNENYEKENLNTSINNIAENLNITKSNGHFKWNESIKITTKEERERIPKKSPQDKWEREYASWYNSSSRDSVTTYESHTNFSEKTLKNRLKNHFKNGNTKDLYLVFQRKITKKTPVYKAFSDKTEKSYSTTYIKISLNGECKVIKENESLGQGINGKVNKVEKTKQKVEKTKQNKTYALKTINKTQSESVDQLGLFLGSLYKEVLNIKKISEIIFFGRWILQSIEKVIIKTFQNEVNKLSKIHENGAVEGIQPTPKIISHEVVHNKKTEKSVSLLNHLYDGNALNLAEKWKTPEIFKGILQLAAGLNHCHSIDISHADIKPDNILYKNENHQLHFADFGGSKSAEEFGWFGISLSSVSHTPAYTSLNDVKQVKNFEQFKKHDIFSFGCTIYSLITQKTCAKNFTESYVSEVKTIDEMKGEIKHALKIDDDHGLAKLICEMTSLNRDKRIDSLNVKQKLKEILELIVNVK